MNILCWKMFVKNDDPFRHFEDPNKMNENLLHKLVSCQSKLHYYTRNQQGLAQSDINSDSVKKI